MISFELEKADENSIGYLFNTTSHELVRMVIDLPLLGKIDLVFPRACAGEMLH